VRVVVGSFWRLKSSRLHLVVRVSAVSVSSVVYQNYYGKFDEFFSCSLDSFVDEFEEFRLF
jgi:hypothetical protein